jgi:DNA (cytosine-5)-methyltransferase 1
MSNKQIRPSKTGFTYTDLFAGVGGFAAALNALGGKHVLSAEVNEYAAITYETNFKVDPRQDVRDLANEKIVKLVSTDVVAGGFPCQPFSKSGAQAGTMDKVRGTLFENIIHFVKANKPTIIVLENVRNLLGPKHIEDYKEIIYQLRAIGYRVSDQPSIISPHLLAKEFGGRPQSRSRVYITATLNPAQNSASKWESPLPAVTPQILFERFGELIWNLKRDLPLTESKSKVQNPISKDELEWLKVWESFLQAFRKSSDLNKLPGFPLWSDVWFVPESPEFENESRKWKIELIEKNKVFYLKNKEWIDKWLEKNPKFKTFPHSRRKFEWQAGDETSIWSCAIQLRPSGVRVKKLNYLPALVAVNQSSIIGAEKRKLSAREAARLQGFPEGFLLSKVPTKEAFKQMGNAVHIGSVFYVLRQHVIRDKDLLIKSAAGKRILESVLSAKDNPDEIFKSWGSKPKSPN